MYVVWLSLAESDYRTDINLYTWSAKQAPECGAAVTAAGSVPIGSEVAVTQRSCFSGSPTCALFLLAKMDLIWSANSCKLGAIQWWRLE